MTVRKSIHMAIINLCLEIKLKLYNKNNLRTIEAQTVYKSTGSYKKKRVFYSIATSYLQ